MLMKLTIIIVINCFIIISNFHNCFDKALMEIFQFCRALHFNNILREVFTKKRFQKRKKRQTAWLIFFAFGICASKAALMKFHSRIGVTKSWIFFLFQKAIDQTKWTPSFEVRKFLTEKKIGERNPDHIHELIRLFEQSSVSADKYRDLETLAQSLNSTQISIKQVRSVPHLIWYPFKMLRVLFCFHCEK